MMEVDRVCRENNVDGERRVEFVRKVEAGVEEFKTQNLYGKCELSLRVDDDGEVKLVGSPLSDTVDLNDGADQMDAFARDIMRRFGCSREEAELRMENMHLYRKEGKYYLVSDTSINNNTCGCIVHKTDK